MPLAKYTALSLPLNETPWAEYILNDINMNADMFSAVLVDVKVVLHEILMCS